MKLRQALNPACGTVIALIAAIATSLCFAVASEAAQMVDVKVNGSDGPITLTQADTLTVTLAMDNGGVTTNADYWVAMNAPFGFLFDSATGWGQTAAPFRQGPLTSFGPTVLFTTSLAGVPTGTYTFYFGVDMTMDGALTVGSLTYDAATVHVISPGTPGGNGYVVDWNENGNRVFGSICNGLDHPFTLNFDSGGSITGTLSFTPASGNGGTVHLSGSLTGGAVTYTGDGTYSVDSGGSTPRVIMTIPFQTAVVIPTGQVITTPGINSSLVLQPTNTCPH
jgi:hypothetical protein